MIRKLPPYAKRAIKRSDWKQQRNVWIYMGWNKYRPHKVGNTTFGAHHASINVVAPEDESPDSMRWGWLDGRSVVLVGDNDQEQRIDQLTPLLAAAGVDEITWLASTQIIPIRVVSREVAA